MSENENNVIEQPEPSRLRRIKSSVITGAIFVVPSIVMAGSMYASVKMSKMQLETARLNLEAAKLNNQ